MADDLSPEEEALLDRFRAATRTYGTLRVSNIWIIQWLPSGDRETGTELADWANQRRPGWAALYRCQSKHEVIEAIASSASYARSAECSPVLHIEAHGGENGILGPDENGVKSTILWEELTEPLQQLNEATGCNLLVIMAACIGNAGVQSFTRGPRAPAIALIGPTETILPWNLLEATKEGYRLIESGDADLDDMVSGMSSESGAVAFVDHRFTAMFYDVFMSDLIRSARPKEKEQRRSIGIEQLMLRGASREQAENALKRQPEATSGVREFQQVWDQMFCIDVCPENQERFGLDMAEIYQAAEALVANQAGLDRA